MFMKEMYLYSIHVHNNIVQQNHQMEQMRSS